MVKARLKQKAITLRKQGLTYSEILKRVPVAKSTLSLWLRDVGLAKAQKQRITKKCIDAQKRGARRKRELRIAKTNEIMSQAYREVGTVSQRELWLMGVMLYWAEGAKEKEHSIGQGVDFANSDPRMIRLFLHWLTTVVGVERDRIHLGLYIHENSRNRINAVLQYWSTHTQFPKSSFKYIYFKKHNVRTKRKNVGSNYYGLLRLRVKRSSTLNRKIAGWVQGVVDYSGIV